VHGLLTADEFTMTDLHFRKNLVSYRRSLNSQLSGVQSRGVQCMCTVVASSATSRIPAFPGQQFLLLLLDVLHIARLNKTGTPHSCDSFLLVTLCCYMHALIGNRKLFYRLFSFCRPIFWPCPLFSAPSFSASRSRTFYLRFTQDLQLSKFINKNPGCCIFS